ncbi:MAG: SpoIIIAH-like family protein [Christensenellales bacterium]
MTKKKKIILLSVMVALLVVSGVLNFVLSGVPVTDNDPNVSVANFFSEFVTDRESTRNLTMLELKSIIESESTSAEAKSNAESMLLKICSNMETELVLESLIKAKGFNEVAVAIGSTNINVMVEAKELTSEEVAQIVNIVVTETNSSAANVVITPYN